MRRDGLEMLGRRMNECYFSIVRREEKGVKKETIALFICWTKKALEDAIYVQRRLDKSEDNEDILQICPGLESRFREERAAKAM